MKILGLGNALVDLIIKLDNDSFLLDNDLDKGSMQLVELDRSEELLQKLDSSTKELVAGGSAANTIHGLAMLGVEAGFIGRMGNDDLKDNYIQDMSNAGVELFLSGSSLASGRALTLVSPDSERTFATALGASAELSTKDINQSIFRQYKLLHAEGYLVYNRPLFEHALRTAKELGLKCSVDLASYNVVEDNLDFLKRMLKQYVDIVYANEEEAKAFTQLEDPKEALMVLGEYCEHAIVKIGPEGAYALHQGEDFHEPALPATPIDTTGAGDLFATGYTYGIIMGYTVPNCIKIGNILSAEIIQVIGAKVPPSTWQRIKQRIEEISD